MVSSCTLPAKLMRMMTGTMNVGLAVLVNEETFLSMRLMLDLGRYQILCVVQRTTFSGSTYIECHPCNAGAGVEADMTSTASTTITEGRSTRA